MTASKVKTIPLAAVGLSLTTGCGSGLEGVYKAAEVWLDGENVTSEYSYTENYDDGCSYTYEMRLMISSEATGFFFWYYAGSCPDESSYKAGYGTYIWLESQGGGVHHMYGGYSYYEDTPWMYCEDDGDLKCKTIPDGGDVQIRFTKL